VNNTQRTRITNRGAQVIAVCLILACSLAAADKKKSKQQQGPPPVDITKLVWPQPPQTARFRFVTQVSGELDLIGKVKKTSWLEKVTGVSVEEAERPRLIKPYGVAVDSKGRIFVADSGARKVFIFNLETKEMDAIGDKAPAMLKIPLGIAIDRDDRVFVSDSELRRITCFDAQGSVLAMFGEDKLDRPTGLAVDNELRRLYVADAKAGRIHIYDLDSFQHLSSWTSKAPGEVDPVGTLGTPTNIAVDADGLVYVVDTIPNRVEVFDPSGDLVFAFGEQGDRAGKFLRPKGIAVDRDGHIYVADAQFNNVQVFTPKGQPLIAVGRFGIQPGQFGLMAGVTVDRFDRVIITDQLPARIEVLRYVTDAQAGAADKNKGQTAGDPRDGKAQSMR
jgi:DNA-binding beta-propeller fold protein YncE